MIGHMQGIGMGYDWTLVGCWHGLCLDIGRVLAWVMFGYWQGVGMGYVMHAVYLGSMTSVNYYHTP